MKFKLRNKKVLIVLVIIFLALILAGITSQTMVKNKKNPEVTIDNHGQENVSIDNDNKAEENLEKYNNKSFQNYFDWRIYEIENNDYKPSYSSVEIPNIHEVLQSKSKSLIVEVNGSAKEYQQVVLAIVKMLENSQFKQIRIYLEGPGINKFEDKWIAISMDIIDSDVKNRNIGIFAKNNYDGTWTAAYDGSSNKDELVRSVPDEYFKVPNIKNNFYN